MSRENIFSEPDKRENPVVHENEQTEDIDEGVFVYNDDGTPMDTSERTYVSVDLPEEEPGTTSKDSE